MWGGNVLTAEFKFHSEGPGEVQRWLFVFNLHDSAYSIVDRQRESDLPHSLGEGAGESTMG